MKRANITTYDVLVTGNFNKNLQNDAIEKKVSKQFTQYGETKGLFVKENNQGKYVVVRYLSEPDADRAVEEANGILLDGAPILVKRMERRQNKPQGPGSGGSMVVTSGTWVASKDSMQKSQFGKNPDIVPTVEPAGSSSPGPDGEPGMSASLNSRSNMMPVQMCVTHIETPTLFWCQELREPYCTELAKFSQKLADICPSAPKVQGRPEMSKVYAAKYSEDGQWYRCQVKHCFSPEKVKVQYIDFGNCEETNPKEMVELPADMTFVKPYAQKIMMHNTRYIGPKEKEALQYLNEITNDQVLTINPTFRLPDGTGLFAQIFVNGLHLNQDLIEKGYAMTKPPKQGQQQQQQQQQQNDPSPGNQFHIGEGGGYAPVVSRGFGGGDVGVFRPGIKAGGNRGFSSSGDGFGRQMLGEADKLRPGVQRFAAPGLNRGSVPGGEKLVLLPEPPGPMGQVGIQPGQQSGPTYSDLKIELANKQRALEKTSTELSNVRAKIRNLQQEYQVLTGKLEENSIARQLQTAVGLVEKVRRLRSQFSDDQPTAVDEAIELACSQDKLTENSVASLSPLMATLTTYRKMQQEICQVQGKQEIAEEKIEERDSMRRKLYDQLTACITEMEGMPFTERAHRITQCTEKLMNHYDNFLNVPVEGHADFQTAVTQYEDFKMKKQKDFEQTRLQTDQQQQLVQTQLSNIGKSLSLSAAEDAGECNFDLTAQLKQYCASMQQEIAIKSVEASADGSFIASLVQTVQHDLKAEILCVNDFIRLQSEFRIMRAGMEAWLDRKPSVDKLLENRQALRSLKSKLRHKLADKHDAEESDDQDMMEEVQKDVVEIQQEIHNALIVEDKELAELAMLVDTHFPEFLTLHADCGLDTQLKYKGLVKANHEVNHYNLTPVPGSNGRLFFSKFADQDVIVMECLLSDGHHLGREDFLTQLMAYTSITHHALLHPTAVFFDKNNRHAYLRFERGRGDILANHIEFGQVDHNENHLVVKSVAEALSALHGKKVLHGEVNPYSILHHPDGTASLLPPDLSCRPIDRAKNKFTSSNGLDFMAPEMTTIPSGVEPTGVVDMFCMGILILYLACPKEPVSFNPDGSLDQTKVRLEPSACNLVKSLMSHVPHLRPTADMLLQTQYVLNNGCESSSSPKAGATSTQFSTASSDAGFSFPHVAAAAPPASSSIPAFTMPNTQHPPPVNFNQPPPPLPTTYSPAQRESPFSTPPPADTFASVSMADHQPFGEPSGLGANSRDPSPFSPAMPGGDAFYDSSNSGFDPPTSTFETGAPSGFEEAALQQEQHEKESRGTVGQFSATADPSFSMGGDGQGEFEIGTFSINDVNGAGPGGHGRKITRQASADEEFGGGSGGGGGGGGGGSGGSAEDWQSSDGQNGD